MPQGFKVLLEISLVMYVCIISAYPEHGPVLFGFVCIICHPTIVYPSLCQTVFRIVVLGIWDYIENKVEVGVHFLFP